MCGSMADIWSPTTEIRRGKKEEQTTEWKYIWSALLHRATINHPGLYYSTASQTVVILSLSVVFTVDLQMYFAANNPKLTAVRILTLRSSTAVSLLDALSWSCTMHAVRRRATLSENVACVLVQDHTQKCLPCREIASNMSLQIDTCYTSSQKTSAVVVNSGSRWLR